MVSGKITTNVSFTCVTIASPSSSICLIIRAAAVPLRSSGHSFSSRSVSHVIGPDSCSAIFLVHSMRTCSIVGTSGPAPDAATNTIPGPCGCTINTGGASCPCDRPWRVQKGPIFACTRCSRSRSSCQVRVRSLLFCHLLVNADAADLSESGCQHLACRTSGSTNRHSRPRPCAAWDMKVLKLSEASESISICGSRKPGLALQSLSPFL